MMRIFKFISFLLIFWFLISCASTYKLISPQSLEYQSHDLHDNISVSYKYDILMERGNKKYARKGKKKNIKLIAMKITNNTDSVITLGHDAFFYSNGTQLYPMEPIEVKKEIQQIVPAYLPYLLLSFTQLWISDGNNTDSYPIGIVIGPSITIGNIGVANSANKALYKELLENNLINRRVNSGETVYGIIGVKDMEYGTINIKLSD